MARQNSNHILSTDLLELNLLNNYDTVDQNVNNLLNQYHQKHDDDNKLLTDASI